MSSKLVAIHGAIQMLSMAILAKETAGYCYVDGDDVAMAGDFALNLAARELVRFERTYFDAYAYRFASWPPLDGVSAFTYPQKIVPPTAPVQARGKRRAIFSYRFSWFHLPGILLLAYFLVLTLLYS